MATATLPRNRKPAVVSSYQDYIPEPGVTDTTAKKIAFVRVTTFPNGEHGSEPSIKVEAFWKNCDRPSTGGIGLPANKMKLAMRIVDAMLFGGFYTQARRSRDTAGNSYMVTLQCVNLRQANADLLKIGY